MKAISHRDLWILRWLESPTWGLHTNTRGVVGVYWGGWGVAWASACSIHKFISISLPSWYSLPSLICNWHTTITDDQDMIILQAETNRFLTVLLEISWHNIVESGVFVFGSLVLDMHMWWPAKWYMTKNVDLGIFNSEEEQVSMYEEPDVGLTFLIFIKSINLWCKRDWKRVPELKC